MNEANSNGVTSLYIAAEKGHTNIVTFLVKEGKADVDRAMYQGATPLLVAAMKGHKDVVAFLLQHGAAPNQPMVHNKYGASMVIIIYLYG